MAIDLEVKHRLRELEARIKALEDRPQSIISQETLEELARLEVVARQMADSAALESKPSDQKFLQKQTRIEVNRKLCPHCGIKPNHFFHVRSCARKEKQQDGDDRNRSTSDA